MALTGLLACFFLSGAAGLLYQVAWSKALGLLFGHTVYANATVLAVFMGGLAAGSAWLGRRSESAARPIALYGWIELGVAAAGGVSLAGVSAVRWLYFTLAPLALGRPVWLIALRLLGAALVLFLPTFLMGGTLPILVRGLTRTSSELGRRVSRLYWVNTLGGVAGTLAAGFVLLPAVGLRLAIASAVSLNVIAGAAALRLAPRLEATPVGGVPPQESPERAAEAPRVSLAYLLAGFALVGGTAIAYEIAWARLLSTILGSSTYAFSLMLATFLAGMVLGSVLFERWSARRRVTLATFARSQSFTALAVLLFLVFFRELPGIVPLILRATQQSFSALVLAQFAVCALAMLPTAMVFGFNFPAVVVLIAGSRGEASGAGEAVGRACAANTCGAILAALVTGFVLVPWLGSYRVLALGAVANLFLAVTLEFRASPRAIARLAGPLLANALLVAAALYAGWSSTFYDPALASFNPVLYWNYRPAPLTLDEAAHTEDVVFFEDGLNATISVSRSDDYLGLKTNGKVDASTGDISTQLLLADLGAIFHPRPRRALIIGFGSGMTASALARFPEIERMDCIEIEPAVLRAAPYLERLNRGVLSDPRLHLILDDARNALLLSREQYDLIISEPSNPWIAGMASLFSDEFYEAARHRLTPGGIFVQWVQGYALEADDFRMIVATLAPHFEDVTLWRSATADYLLLARTTTASLDFTRARALWASALLREDFDALRLTRPESWPVYFRLGNAQLRAFAAGGARNTDDLTLLEYHAPRSLVGKSHIDELEAEVQRFSTGLVPPELRPSENRAALEAAAESSLELHDDRSAGYVKALAKEAPTAALEVVRGRQALRGNHVADAVSNFQQALSVTPNYTEALYWLAMAKHLIAGDSEGESLLRQVCAREPKNKQALAAEVEFAKDREDWQSAVAAQKQALSAAAQPQPSDFCRLGELQSHAGDLVGARESLREGLVREPYSYLCHRQLGEIDLLQKRPAEARQDLEFVVRYFPDADPGVYSSLASLYMSVGKRDLADAILQKGKRIFPEDPGISRVIQGR